MMLNSEHGISLTQVTYGSFIVNTMFFSNHLLYQLALVVQTTKRTGISIISFYMLAEKDIA
ncbi:MAG: hypothetical protein M3162_04660 [Thermoproteota archaeon]|nr:hypothetical protein [Thermoproteota archaeon]